jgi:DNA-binding response OmpR family regulator
MTDPATGDRPPTVLVVEDEFIIALDLCDTVEELGFALDGPYPDKAHAFEAIERALPDAAILDVNTEDGEVFPLADVLARAGVPIIFHSWSKPCPPYVLVHALQQAVQRRA